MRAERIVSRSSLSARKAQSSILGVRGVCGVRACRGLESPYPAPASLLLSFLGYTLPAPLAIPPIFLSSRALLSTLNFNFLKYLYCV